MIGFRAGLAVGAVVGASVMFGPAHFIGKRHGAQEAAFAAVSSTVKALKERNAADETISNSTLDGLCAYFGLSDDDKNECVRRLKEANAVRSNSGDDRNR